MLDIGLERILAIPKYLFFVSKFIGHVRIQPKKHLRIVKGFVARLRPNSELH